MTSLKLLYFWFGAPIGQFFCRRLVFQIEGPKAEFAREIALPKKWPAEPGWKFSLNNSVLSCAQFRRKHAPPPCNEYPALWGNHG
mmetsp:Transcript_126890/g.219689  ORF Transcript_126890/g.219689 Transcript_126890/m.219689 type:complete len:85 (+) Transcript_126890:1368-1622(+)